MNISAPDQSRIPALRRLWKEAFGDNDTFLDMFFSTAFHPSRCRMISDGADAAAALYWFSCLYENRPLAYLYAVATAKSHQGQGLCHALLNDTKQHLKTFGYEGILLVPGNKELFPFYETMDFKTCSTVQRITCTAASKKISIERIDKTRYQTLRRAFLPIGSVIQEEENLTFLNALEMFYTGPGFLLAAHKKERLLCGTELLGNTDLAPQIVAALGCSSGHFQMPGKETAFAMHCPLCHSNLPAPAYFGLSFG